MCLHSHTHVCVCTCVYISTHAYIKKKRTQSLTFEHVSQVSKRLVMDPEARILTKYTSSQKSAE